MCVFAAGGRAGPEHIGAWLHCRDGSKPTPSANSSRADSVLDHTSLKPSSTRSFRTGPTCPARSIRRIPAASNGTKYAHVWAARIVPIFVSIAPYRPRECASQYLERPVRWVTSFAVTIGSVLERGVAALLVTPARNSTVARRRSCRFAPSPDDPDGKRRIRIDGLHAIRRITELRLDQKQEDDYAHQGVVDRRRRRTIFGRLLAYDLYRLRTGRTAARSHRWTTSDPHSNGMDRRMARAAHALRSVGCSVDGHIT